MFNFFKKVHVLAVIGIITVSCTVFAFKSTSPSNLALVTYGVLDEETTRYQITPSEAQPGHGCGAATFPCTIQFDDTEDQPYQDQTTGLWYVDKGSGIVGSGNGPYTD